METLFGQFKMGDEKGKSSNTNNRKEEKGSVDFSCGNLMRSEMRTGFPETV